MKFDYPKNARFRCERCAVCCGDTKDRVRSILLLKIDADHISKKTRKPLGNFAERIVGFKPYVYRMKKTKDGKCVFLNANECSIYRIRPLICRFYPFQLESFKVNRYIFNYTHECPGIGKGSKLGKGYFEKLFVKLVDLLNKDECQDSLK